MASIRIKRIESEISKILNYALSFKLRDKRLDWVNISKVKVTPDLKYAKIYYSTLSHDVNHNMIVKGFSSAKGFLRKSIADAKFMRIVPELSFVYDDTEEKASRLDDIFAQINKDKKNEESEE